MYVSAIEQTVFEAWLRLKQNTPALCDRNSINRFMVGFERLGSGAIVRQLPVRQRNRSGRAIIVHMFDMAGVASMTAGFLALKGDYSSFEPMIGDWSTDSE